MSLRRLRIGDWLAGFWGLALLAVLSMDWFGTASAAVSAWEVFGFVDLLLAAVATLALAVVLVTAIADSPAVAIAIDVVFTAVAIVALPVVAYRLVNEPGPNALVSVETGAYLGLLCAAALVHAGYLTMRDESSPGHAPQPAPEPMPPPL